MTEPLCRCHGVPMSPHSGANGQWRCRVLKCERDARYIRTPKGRARRMRAACKRRESAIQLYEEALR